MKELERLDDLLVQLRAASPRTRLAFTASIAERLLPGAKRSLTKWRNDSWPTLRNALDLVWQYLEGNRLPQQRYIDLKEACYTRVPHDEDPNFDGGFGAQEASIAVVNALILLFDSEPKHAFSSSALARGAIRTFLIFTEFPEARTHREIDEDAIFHWDIMQAEIQLERRQLGRLRECETNEQDFAAVLAEIKDESAQKPIILSSE